MKNLKFLMKRTIQLDIGFLSIKEIPLVDKISFIAKKYFHLLLDTLFKAKFEKRVSVLGTIFNYESLYDIGFLQSYVIDEMFLTHFIPKNATIIDIGANIGQSNIFYYKILGASRVYSFEPLSKTFILLQKNTTQKKYVYNYAVTQRKAVTLKLGDSSLGASIYKDGRNIKRMQKEGISVLI